MLIMPPKKPQQDFQPQKDLSFLETFSAVAFQMNSDFDYLKKDLRHSFMRFSNQMLSIDMTIDLRLLFPDSYSIASHFPFCPWYLAEWKNLTKCWDRLLAFFDLLLPTIATCIFRWSPIRQYQIRILHLGGQVIRRGFELRCRLKNSPRSYPFGRRQRLVHIFMVLLHR